LGIPAQASGKNLTFYENWQRRGNYLKNHLELRQTEPKEDIAFSIFSSSAENPRNVALAK
jgi:hypothetical protein